MKTYNFLLAFLFITSALSAQVTLKFDPPKGKYIYKIENNAVMNTGIEGQTMNISMSTDFDWDMSVLEKTNTGSDVEFVYSRLRFLMDMPMGKFEYDTKKEPESLSEQEKMMKGVFDAFIGKPITATITKDGSITSIKGFDAIMNSVNTQSPNNMGAAFGENSMKNLFEQSMKMFPDKPINIGESWIVKQIIAQEGLPSINMDATYTLKSIDKGIANIDVVATIDTKINAPTGQEISATGTMSGNMKMEVSTGIQTEGNIQQKIKMMVGGQQIDMTSNIKTTMAPK